MDVFEYAGQEFLALIDAYSGFLIVEHLKRKTSGHIIEKITKNFDKIGYPTIMKSDNSPFASHEFDEFARKHNIVMRFSSPRYPQSNGLAEKAVAIAKNILKRCVEMNDTKHYQYRILEYNTTPVASMGMAPTQLFFGRLLETRLPVTESLLHRNKIDEQIVQQKITKKKDKQKFYYDKNAKALSTLGIGDSVIFRKDGNKWTYGTIVGTVNDKSYIIKDQFDNHFRRNRRFIAKTRNNGFEASELMVEERFVNTHQNNNENLEEIQITTPKSAMQQQTSFEHPENVTVDEFDLPAVNNNEASSDEYETAGSNDSETDGDDNIPIQNINAPIRNPNEWYRTRSGRPVIRPSRYRCETITYN